MTNNSPSTANSTSSSSDRSCSVENILNEMTRSFATCKTSRLFQFYDSACKKGSDCSMKDINWTSNKILMNPLASISGTTASSTAAATDCLSSAWLSSRDFLTSSALAVTGGANLSNTTPGNLPTSSSSSSHDLYQHIANVSNQLITENRLITSVTNQIEETLTNFMSNTIGVTSTGVFLGAVVGAAIATGVVVGLMTATGAIAASGSEYMPSLLQLLQRRRRRLGDPSKPKSPDHSSSDVTDNNSSTTASSVSTNGPLIILQGHPSASTFGSAEEQCLSCLQNIEANLKQQGMEWTNVCRITAYLVSGKCEAGTFRRILSSRTAATNPLLVSILFVQQLEDKQAMLQVEAMASKA